MQQATKVQERLNELGVQDVKFLFVQNNQRELPPSVVLADIEEVLTRHLNGECIELPPFKDERPVTAA